MWKGVQLGWSGQSQCRQGKFWVENKAVMSRKMQVVWETLKAEGFGP